VQALERIIAEAMDVLSVRPVRALEGLKSKGAAARRRHRQRRREARPHVPPITL